MDAILNNSKRSMMPAGHHSFSDSTLLIIIIKCMCSRCRRDDIHACFAYASPQRMPHMYDHKTVSLKYII